MAAEKNSSFLHYPMTKMNFVVTVNGVDGGTAAFSEVSGIESSVDVVEFRQGNSHSLAPVKIPGLVKHGNLTLKMGYTNSNDFKEWVINCVSEHREGMPRQDVRIELIDIRASTPSAIATTVSGNTVWTLKDAWVAKYTGPDLNASSSEVAIESIELAYEELEIPN